MWIRGVKSRSSHGLNEALGGASQPPTVLQENDSGDSSGVSVNYTVR